MSASSAEYYEVRWRIQGSDEAWSNPQRVSPVGEIVVTELERDKSYDFQVRSVSNCGAKSLWVDGSHAVPTTPAGTLTLADLQTSAADAQAAADAANAALASISSDGILAAGEKPPVIRDYSVITTEQAGIDAQATAYGITTEKTTYDGKVTALTTYLGTLGGTTAWNDLSGNTTIDGPTFRAKFADVYTSRQALLNAIYAAAKSKADTAKAAADAAQAAADKAGSAVPVINPRFVGDTLGWTFDNPAGLYRETGANSPDSACSTYLVRQGQSGGATTYVRNLGYVSVVPGQTIIVTACLKSLSANAGAYAGCRISWRNAAHAEVAASLASVTVGPGGTYLQAVSKATGQAPSTAQFAHFELYYVSHSSGFITATSCGMTVQPASIDEVPDGGAYGRTRLSGLVNGTVPLAGAGKSLLANPTFTRNAMGIPVGFTAATPNDYLKDNWKVIALANPQLAQISEATDILLSTATGVAIANGSQAVATVVSEQFPLSANQTLVGELISGFANIGGPPAGISCLLRPFIRFVNASGGVIGSYQMPDIGRGGGTSRGAGLSPSGTASAYLEVNHYLVNTSGSTYITGSSIADFRLTSFNAYSVSNIDDEVRDGTTYGRTSQSDLYVSGGVNRVGLRVAGSGQQVGDQRNLVSSITRNLGITRSAIALTAKAGGSVDINAHTIQMGAASVSYAAKTNAVTGLTTSSSYYIYTRDNYAGGSPTWFPGTNQNVVNSYDDAYNAGVVTIPTSGTSGGGAGGGGIDQCVAAGMYLRRGLTARQLAERWRWWRPYILHGQDGWHFVRQRPRIVPQLCCRITVADGSTVDCSLSTPVTVRTGDSILAPMVYGHDLWTDSGWQRVINVELLHSERDVVHISTGGHSFLAGTIAHLRISTHNLLKN